MRTLRRLGLAAALVVLLGAAAADPADRLGDPGNEARARALFRDVRCLVCQSQSIDESDAPLARDLRQLIRQQVADGRSDGEIRSYLVSRYGQFVLLSPKASLGNAILWVGPLLVVFAGAAALIVRGRRPAPATSLTVEEEAELENLSAKLSGRETS
ncbi:MAG TPA: cytochrome c-type biogenesis protein [Caulobacteraceae bacterium]|nr:cytochrome c-type biogenesis protein [Caulobacteraceae bacterium]